VKPAALVYLRDNPAAQRLVVAWGLVAPRTGPARSLVARWAALADVPPHVAARLAPVLRAHQLVHDDGTVDPLAEQFIASQVMSSMKGVRR
jgi:hypothetical protein